MNAKSKEELIEQLYRNGIEKPIIDYHSHLDPKEIATDKRFYNLTQLWLSHDHYKWRLMRACGIPEEEITGNLSDRQKFYAFARILPRCIGNPIYTWCHLELKKYFNIEDNICEANAKSIYDRTEAMMRTSPFTAQHFIRESNVLLLCTTDDPLDDLSWHEKLAENQSQIGFKVLPTFRPDKAIHIESLSFTSYIRLLTGKETPSFSDVKKALASRLNYFIEHGCFLSDHALEEYIYVRKTDQEIDEILNAALHGKLPNTQDIEGYQTELLLFLADLYEKKGIAMQLHFNCLRNVNISMFSMQGADSGYDCINVVHEPKKLANFFDSLYREQSLPKTIVYSLDPNDNAILQTIINCFQGGCRGKIQHGSAWWFNDTRNGIKHQLITHAEYGVLGNFIGMLTDSRSFSSYVRHDYFRKLLCEVVAEFVEQGEYPDDENALFELIDDICFRNAKEFFDL